MEQNLQTVLELIIQNELLSAEEKELMISKVKEADKKLTIAEFKLDRTEKVKRTTAILLEETIQELELKRKAAEESNTALQQSLEDLRAAQAQLIQSEKMASLGELTAGIAHEIQNPLNFVNNFSEVSKELIEELNEERTRPKEERDEELEEEILTDIHQNLDKINHHGQRASAIVKGMLQHSRSSEGHKEPTDINALADEYLRLAYHGLRAKDKSFNAAPMAIGIKTDFDDAIPKIEVVPQDVGRVLLNLINNAFYSVHEKTKSDIKGYQPKVVVSTKNTKTGVEISVKDNGSGIPDAIKAKIFQPFFTTKPTGQGTGLGLSLSYDIITKGHSGNLSLETKENEGTTFFINLPVNHNP